MKYILIFFIIFIWAKTGFTNSQIVSSDSLIDLYINSDNNYTPVDKIKLLIQVGDELKFNHPDSAIQYYNLAFELATTKSYINKEATLLNRIGSAKYRQGDYAHALDYYLKALNIYRSSNNKNGIAVGLNNVAIILNMLDKKEEAIENHINSALLCIEAGDSVLLATNYFNIGLVNYNLQNYDTALIYVDKSEHINALISNKGKLYELNTLKGNIYIEQGNTLMAKEEFLKVINNKDITNKWEVSYALAGLALAEQKLGNLEESIVYGEKSLQLAKEVHAKWDIQNITKILSTSYALNDDYKGAYNAYKEHKLFSDSLFNEEKENRINYLLLKQEDFEYIILAKENIINTERLQKKNNQMLLFTLGLLIFILITIYLYRTNFLKAKLNKELHLKNTEIAQKNKELIQLNATKDTFFRIIGHDLKSPMSTVVSFTDLLEQTYDDLSKKEVLEYISITKKSALNTIELLENLIEWAKAQTGITIVKPIKININNLINDSIKQIRNIIIAKNIDLEINCDKNLTAVLDKNMTASIIRNLLTNAVKFTNENGEINISVQKDNTGIIISVSDNGVGMSEEKLDSLFKIEYAKSSLGTNKEKGTGIGLILCKELANKQGGDIWGESELGVGSTFYFRV